MKEHSPSSRKAKLPLNQAEWDFSACPENELMECCLYEYARSSEEKRKAYALLQKEAESAGKSGWMGLHAEYGLNTECPEFPDIPWLKIENKHRLRRVAKILDFGLKGFSVDPTNQRPSYIPSIGEEFRSVEICWAAPKAKIIEDFSKWVNEHYDKYHALVSETERWPKRLTSTIKGMLKALSALRLLKLMSWDEAQNFTQKQLGEPLYAEHSAWINARKKAESFLGGAAMEDE